MASINSSSISICLICACSRANTYGLQLWRCLGTHSRCPGMRYQVRHRCPWTSMKEEARPWSTEEVRFCKVPAHITPNFWDHPKILGIFWDVLVFRWGHLGVIPKTSQNIPSNPKKQNHQKKSAMIWDGSQNIPKHPRIFWGQLGWFPKKLGSSQKNWGHFGMVWGRHTRVRNSHTEARKNIYIRHRDGINVHMYCKCVWLEHEVEVSRICAEKHRIYQNIPANVHNPKKSPKKSQIFWDPKKILRKSQENPKFFGHPKTPRIPKKLNIGKSKEKRT